MNHEPGWAYSQLHIANNPEPNEINFRFLLLHLLAMAPG